MYRQDMYKQEIFPIYHHTDNPEDVPGGPAGVPDDPTDVPSGPTDIPDGLGYTETLDLLLGRKPAPQRSRVIYFTLFGRGGSIKLNVQRADGSAFPRPPKPADTK